MLSFVSSTPRRSVAAASSMTTTRTRRITQTPTVASITRNRQQQRKLSTNIMSTPIPAPAPVGIMSMKPPKVVSRRAWQQQQQQQQRNGNDAQQKASAAASGAAQKTAPEKPWPASMRYTAYAAAVTVIPYLTAWIISYNPSLRSLVFQEPDEVDDKIKSSSSNKSRITTTLEDYLRWQFGTEDEEEAQTTTRHEEEDENAIPQQFPNEWPYSIRRAQAAIRALEKDQIFVRIGILTNTNNDGNTNEQTHPATAAITDGMSGPYSALGDMNNDAAAYYYHLLPGSTPARIDAIINSMKNSASTTTSDNRASRGPFPPPFLSSVSLDFEDVSQSPPALQTKMSGEAVDSDNDEDKVTTTQQSTLAKQQQHQPRNNDPLLKQVSCFSLWHYQDAAILHAQIQAKQQRQEQHQQNTTSNNNKRNDNNINSNDDSMEMARLEYQVQQFQEELNNAASSLRAVDDIRHDLQESKAALKRLKNNRGGGSWSWSLW